MKRILLFLTAWILMYPVFGQRTLEWSVGPPQITCEPTLKICYPLRVAITDASQTPALGFSTIRFFFDRAYLNNLTAENIENGYTVSGLSTSPSNPNLGTSFGFLGGQGSYAQLSLNANTNDLIALSTTPVHVMDLCFDIIKPGPVFPLCAPFVFDNNPCGWDQGNANDNSFISGSAGLVGLYYLNNVTTTTFNADDEVTNYLWTNSPSFDCLINTPGEIAGTTSSTGCLESVCLPSINIAKTASPATYDAAGDIITYTFTVQNTSNVTLTNVTVTDPLPGLSAVSPASIATLAPGATQVFTATYTITQANMDAGSVMNTATATGTYSGNPVTDTDSETINAVQNPAINITKAASPAIYDAVGNVITYTFTVQNTGNVTLTNVTVSDPLAGLSAITPASVASLAPGANALFTATYTITQADLNGGSVVNTATATGTPPVGPPVTDTDTETISSNPDPEITITKTASPAIYDAVGDVITYTFTVENTGNVTLTNVTVSDPLVGLSAISPASIASLVPGATQVFTATYTITQADLNGGSVVNTATATGTPPTGPPVTDTDTETVPADQNPSLNITKTASPQTYNAVGNVITYTFTVQNTGNVTLTNVTVSDPLVGLSATTPASVASLAPGATQVFTATYTITQANLNNGSVVNTATATGTPPTGPPVTDTDTETINAVQNPSLNITKTASPQTYSAVGNVITYTFTVQNTGNVTLTNVTVSDPLVGLSAISPASVASVAPGANAVFTATYIITQANLNSGSVVNTATATGTPPTGPPVTDTDTETINANQNPALNITKTASPATYDAVGDVITYTFTVQNTGNVTLTNVTVSDPLVGLSAITPASIASLVPGATQVFTATYTITQVDLNSGSVVNTATTTGTPPTGPPVTDTDTETVPADQNPSLNITKTASPQTYNAVGNVITYTFTVQNTGNVTLTNVTVSDPLVGLSAITPASIASLAPGATQVFTATYTITQANLNSGSVVNTATATGTPPTGPPVTDTDTETINAVQNPALNITKTASPATYDAVGDVITYTFTVQNTGNVTLTNVTVSDPLVGLSAVTPASVASLAPGATQVFTATYTITQANLNSGSVVNTATATGTPPTGPPVTDTDTETVPADQNPALNITKTASPATYDAVGDVITYTFTVQNTGNVTLTNVTVSDPLVGLSAVTPASVASLVPGATQVFTATYTITQADLNSGSVVNTATATGTPPTGPPVTDTDTETIPADQNPALNITKTGAPLIYNAVGDVITYTFTVQNTGNVTLTNVTVSDPLVGLSAVTPASVASLAPGATQVFTATYTITQADLNNGSVVNTATTTGTPPTGPPVTDTDTETISSNPDPEITITKTASPLTYDGVGDVITYTFTVQNTGNVTLTNVTVSDPLVGLSAVTPASVASLAPGATQVFTATYTITQADLNGGSVVNTATATGTPPTGPPVTDTDTETVPAVQNPAINITKSASPATYDAVGDVITYTFTVQNTGNVTLTNVTVSDPLVGLSAVTPASVASLAPGATQVFTATYTITQADLNSGSVVNTATTTGTPPTGPPVTDTDTETVPADQNPALNITKTASPATYDAVGDVITYTFTVQNTGNVTLTNVTVSDPLVGLSAITPASVASLAPGATQVFTATYTITQADLNSGSVVNTATTTGTPPTGPPVTDTDTETVPADQNPSLNITKTASPQTYNAVGNVITYTFTVQNTGNVTLTNVTVSDPLVGLSAISPASVASLAPGATQVFTATYTITQANLNSGSVVNTATATGTPPTGPPVTDTDTETINAVQNPSLNITKTASPATYDAVGDVITYTFTVQNTGNVTLTNVTVSDPLVGLSAVTPASVASLVPGATQVFTATYTITQANLNSGSVVNTATATGTPPTGPPVTDTDTETVPADQNPSLNITKTASPATYDAVGDVITYTFTVQNTGNVTLTNVTVSDPLAGLSAVTPASVASLAPGATQVFTATYTITQADLNGGSVVNTATATGTPPTGPPVTDTDTETVPADQNPALNITKTASPATYDAVGDVITYTFTVQNTGNVTLTNVTVSDPLVGLSAITPVSIASLAPGATQVFTATYTITQADLNSGSVVNTATTTGTPPTGPPVTDTDTETVPADQNPALIITKTASPLIYDAVGDVITYTFTVQNTGNVTLTNVTVSDPLVGLSAVTPASVASLAPGATQVFTATYTITQADLNGGSVVNTATATGTPPTGPPVTDTDTETISSNPDPEITITKTASPLTYDAVGDVITYTFTVQNTGNVTLTNVTVSDPLVGLSAVTPASVASLVPGATQVFTATYTITQADLNGGSVVNTATATGTPPTGPPVTDTDTETVPAVQSPAINITKSASPATYDAVGDVITYTFTVQNTGNVTLTNVTVSDPLVGLSAVTPASVASLAPGATQVFTATYTITQANLNSGSVVNTATATGTPPTGPPVTDTDTETVPADQNPALNITKTASPATYDAVGDVITYTFTVQNTGNVTLTNVTVSDPLVGLSAITPASVASLAPGATQVFTATYTITQADLNSGSVVNTATTTGTPPTGPPVTDTDTETVPADQNPSLSVIKSATGTVGSNGFITKVLYSIVVRNTGNVTVSNIQVTDNNGTITGGTNPIPSLLPGASATLTAEHIVTSADVTAGYVQNTATATGDSPQGNDDVTDVSDAGTFKNTDPIANPEGTETPNGQGGVDGNSTNDPTVYNLCVDWNLFVYLEGSLVVPQTGAYQTPMRTTLNSSLLLPGQFQANVFGGGGVFTQPLGSSGQAYNIAPWNYSGSEGNAYNFGGNLANASAGYAPQVVDWVLVSLRRSPENGAEKICQRAGLLYSDGRIEFTSGTNCCALDPTESFYVVIEHRNHLIVMSHAAVPVVNGTLNYDFRNKQSYLVDPLNLGTYYGQTEVLPGVFAMHAGNGEQAFSMNDDVDINAADIAKWINNGAQQRTYNILDFNMDGEVSALDFDLWERNATKFSSVPRN